MNCNFNHLDPTNWILVVKISLIKLMFFGDTDLPHAPLCNNSTQRDESQIIVFRGNNNILHMYQHKFYKIKKIEKRTFNETSKDSLPDLFNHRLSFRTSGGASSVFWAKELGAIHKPCGQLRGKGLAKWPLYYIS